MRFIDADAAIDAISEMMPTPYTPDGSHPADEGIFMAQELFADCIQNIEDLPTIEQPQWIPVSKDTPKTSANVIISHEDGVALGWYDGKHWLKGGYLCETVKAWMPLPKALR